MLLRCQFGAGVNLLSRLTEKIIEVEIYLFHDRCSCRSKKSVAAENEAKVSSESPFYLACKRNASMEVLNHLLDASSRHQNFMRELRDEFGLKCDCYIDARSWIAPVTGTETWESLASLRTEQHANKMIPDLSPLGALWNRFPMANFEDGSCDDVCTAIKHLRGTPMSTFGARIRALDAYINRSSSTDIFFKTLFVLLWSINCTEEPRISEECMKSKVDPTWEDMLLHFISALKYPISSFLSIILKVFLEEDAFMRDQKGLTPIHHAMLSYSFSTRERKNHCAVIMLLTNAYPRASKIEFKDGRVPIIVAVENGIRWNEGIESLVKATPEYLWARDKKYSLYPFMLAAVGTNNSLHTVFELLCALPELVGEGITVSS